MKKIILHQNWKKMCRGKFLLIFIIMLIKLDISIDYTHIQHSNEHSKLNSFFQGHCAIVEDSLQAKAALNSIYQSPDLSVADHLMYAYRYTDQSGTVHSGFSDDHEIKGCRILHTLLEEQDKLHHLLCVTRLKKGFNIGPVRFDLIKTAAQEVLSMPQKPETPQEFYHRLV